MAFSTTPQIGVDLNGIQRDVSLPITGDLGRSQRVLNKVFGSDGATYQCGIAAAAIPANAANVIINPANGNATVGEGGTATGPAAALAVGDIAWFRLPA